MLNDSAPRLTHMANSSDVQAFYDEFLQSRMLGYRLHGSLRLEKAAARILPELTPDSLVLDIGCGIGIVTERMARVAKNGHVWGVDISEKNVWYARQTAQRSNLTFLSADIIRSFQIVNDNINTPVNVVTLIDVIEHLPAEERPVLFSRLRQMSSDNAKIILTYPSPEYQRYLRLHQPDGLQIIDNEIELPDLLHEAGQAGFRLRHYSLEHMWQSNQYVHCIFQTDTDLAPIKADATLVSKAYGLIQREIDRYLFLPFRKKKYINRVFNR